MRVAAAATLKSDNRCAQRVRTPWWQGGKPKSLRCDVLPNGAQSEIGLEKDRAVVATKRYEHW